MIDFLTYNVDSDYRFVKLGGAVYNIKENTLTCTFLFSPDVAEKLHELKPALERHITAKVNDAIKQNIKIKFEYKKSYTDELLLKLEIKKLLTREFSILTLNLTDEDIHIERHGNTFSINLYLPTQSIEYIKTSKSFNNFVKTLHDENFCTFEFYFDAKATSTADTERALEKLEKYMEDSLPSDTGVRVDKTLKVKSIEYWLGKPIKSRPIKIEYLRVSNDEQVTAGEMKFLTKREFNRVNKDTNETETRTFWTFVLDDGHSRANCVFFPTDKTLPKFEKLVNGTHICVIGTNTERNGRMGFRVAGVSFCEMG